MRLSAGTRQHDYVLSVHSPKAVMVEQLSAGNSRTFQYVLADAIIQLTMAKGTRHEVSVLSVVIQSFLFLFWMKCHR